MMMAAYLLLVVINRWVIAAVGHVVEHGVGYSTRRANFKSESIRLAELNRR